MELAPEIPGSNISTKEHNEQGHNFKITATSYVPKTCIIQQNVEIESSLKYPPDLLLQKIIRKKKELFRRTLKQNHILPVPLQMPLPHQIQDRYEEFSP